MTDRTDASADDFDPNDASRHPDNRLGGTMDAPPTPSADTFAREMVGGEDEPELPIVGEGEVDTTPELPTHEHRDGSA
ncbi:MAG TPA: hypothetical protein VGT61_01145 [Thermomicrobiales bacterium]|jgi:hypothetical protein|nr:hypothetical protein [Thermomicrobiales bacterium]